jgi:hypothetical protein
VGTAIVGEGGNGVGGVDGVLVTDGVGVSGNLVLATVMRRGSLSR